MKDTPTLTPMSLPVLRLGPFWMADVDFRLAWMISKELQRLSVQVRVNNVYVFREYINATHFSLESLSLPEALLLKTRRHSSRRRYTVVTPRSFYSSKSLFLMGVTSQGIKAYNSVVRDFLFPGECELKILR